MAKISHFVVTYNHLTGVWELDNDLVQTLGGNVFDTESNEWENPLPGTKESKVDALATEKMHELLQESTPVESNE